MNIRYDERVDGVLPDVDKNALLQALQTQLPDLEILHRQEEIKPYECDGLSACRTTSIRSRTCFGAAMNRFFRWCITVGKRRLATTAGIEHDLLKRVLPNGVLLRNKKSDSRAAYRDH